MSAVITNENRTGAAPRGGARAFARVQSEVDASRLESLRELADQNLDHARVAAWGWFQELQDPRNHERLPWLFARGTSPEGPGGHCRGIVMHLEGAPWLTLLDRLVRLGQMLGGIGWTGKSFDLARGTGFNRLTSSARLAAFLTMPTYRFRRLRGELVGFDFNHAIERSPVAPHPEVRAIKYDAPEHGNPLVLPRTRDELVEIVPGVYLGRALVRDGDVWRVVGYFGLLGPEGER